MKYSSLFLAAALFALAGCTGPVIMGTDAAITVATRPGSPPPADTASQIPAHESWCYTTMGDPQCYTQAQDVWPDRLINVDPQNRYPLDPTAYRQTVAAQKMAATSSTVPTSLIPSPTVGVDQKDELGAAGTTRP